MLHAIGWFIWNVGPYLAFVAMVLIIRKERREERERTIVADRLAKYTTDDRRSRALNDVNRHYEGR